jgi:hypothetical protein
VTLLDLVGGESTRAAHSSFKDGSYQAAEAGLDDYVTKLVEDNLYYLHYVHPGESTRKDTPSGTNVVVSGSCSAASKPAAAAWAYSKQWTYPNGKDRWCQLGNGYEYNLEVFPPTGPTNLLTRSVQIIATGRKVGSTIDRRVIQEYIKLSSVADYYRMVNGPVSWGSGANTYGEIYAKGAVTHDGDAYANIYSEASVSGSVVMHNGAAKYSPSTSPGIRTVIPQPIDFTQFLNSLSDINRAAGNAGVVLTPAAGYTATKVLFKSDGTFTTWSCKPSSGTDIAANVPTCVTLTPPGCSAGTCTMPTNGAIYSADTVIVADASSTDTVNGRVTVASNDDVVVGGNLVYATPGDDVLGLDANNDVVIAAYAGNPLTWNAAVLAQNGTWKTDTQGGSGTMNFTGAAVTQDGGSLTQYSTRNYNYDSNLQFLPPPWFPMVNDDYTITLFRELPSTS